MVVSRTMLTGHSAIKQQSKRLKEAISRQEQDLKQVVDILEKTYKDCHKKLAERLSKTTSEGDNIFEVRTLLWTGHVSE